VISIESVNEREPFCSAQNRSTSMMIFFGLLLLICGSLIYVGYRPKSLLMFEWLDYIGIGHFIDWFRGSFSSYKGYFSNWFIYSMPFGLWVIASVLFMAAIWNKSNGRERLLWIYLIPVCSIISEVMQAFGVIRGTFDIVALSVLNCFFIISFLIERSGSFRLKKERYYDDVTE